MLTQCRYTDQEHLPDVDTQAHILIVEDDPSVGDALVDYLRRHGYTVSLAVDAAQMSVQMENQRPALIVLDVMLPGEDGLSICRRLAAQGPPILMLSALGATTDRIVGLELGAADYLASPSSRVSCWRASVQSCADPIATPTQRHRLSRCCASAAANWPWISGCCAAPAASR